ncbi:hypothetical protein C7999DRAFT_30487 [Corynascus novoguineensis]|uniref:Uncharacterized protein n=1 Tax=Corynascus novoguineensis TaxID=1126955 RepID=A0AAN7CVH2_9PEZI|nr:hypothetical protein C7999DRAFT_30487 [Corynascus novoguineensis]
MSRREPTPRSSSVYSQDSGRGRTTQTGTVMIGGMPRSTSPSAIDYARSPPLPSRFSVSTTSSGQSNGALSHSSRHSGSGSGAPPLGRPSSSGGSSPAVRPGSRGSGGGSRPATPAHADIMSAYGHSSYGRNTDSLGTFIETATQTSAARGPPPSSTYSKTFIDSSPHAGPARGSGSVGSSRGSGGRGGRRNVDSGSSLESNDSLYYSNVLSNVPPDDLRRLGDAAQKSRERRRRAGE